MAAPSVQTRAQSETCGSGYGSLEHADPLHAREERNVAIQCSENAHRGHFSSNADRGRYAGLEQDGFVSRAVQPTNPPRVEYALTPLGTSLLGPVWEVCALGEEESWARPGIPPAQLAPADTARTWPVRIG